MCYVAIHYHPACAHITVAHSVPCPAGPCLEDKVTGKVIPLAENQVCEICIEEEQDILIAAISDALMAYEDDEAAAAQLQRELARTADEADVEWDLEREACWREREG
ncbi:hypothetical protein MMC27_004926 [Xylographa pallens]|nr:hypothetical protein [Xylographa pallens]